MVDRRFGRGQIDAVCFADNFDRLDLLPLAKQIRDLGHFQSRTDDWSKSGGKIGVRRACRRISGNHHGSVAVGAMHRCPAAGRVIQRRGARRASQGFGHFSSPCTILGSGHSRRWKCLRRGPGPEKSTREGMRCVCLFGLDHAATASGSCACCKKLTIWSGASGLEKRKPWA